ncbi:MAG: Zn-ribbon domain-containing OB-fold protein [Conexivisphaerales archaeon]
MSVKMKSLPGKAISSEELEAGKFSVEEYEARLMYSWSSGVAVSRFLEGLKKGELWGRRCDRCRRTMIPPRMYCEVCFRPTDRWVRLKDTGSINTYSVCWVNTDASRRKEPLTIAVIGIDGASENMGILHYVDEIKPEQVKIGMKVKAVWKPEKERVGSILDIRYFKPLQEE